MAMAPVETFGPPFPTRLGSTLPNLKKMAGATGENMGLRSRPSQQHSTIELADEKTQRTLAEWKPAWWLAATGTRKTSQGDDKAGCSCQAVARGPAVPAA